MLVGLTGQIGSGKSYVLNTINSVYHYEVIQTDVIAKKSYDDEIIKKKLDESFLCLKDGKVDIMLLKQNLNGRYDLLNDIIHPYVRKKLKEIDHQGKIIFVELPLLFESKMEDIFDVTVAIDISDELRHQRIKNRNKDTYKYYLNLEKYQWSTTKKCSKATYILKQNENDDDNKRYLSDIIKEIERKKSYDNL